MSFLNDMLSKLTNNYSKNESSNIGKIFKLVSDELDEIKSLFETIESYRDIDTAEGTTLDLIGKNLDEARGNKSDSSYRDYLKTRIKSNLSAGDIETLNEILEVFYEDDLIAVKENWQNEPASLRVITKTGSRNVPTEVIKRIVACGVGILEEVQSELTQINIFSTNHNSILEYAIAGTFEAGQEPFEYYIGKLSQSDFNIKVLTSNYLTSYYQCGGFECGEITL